MMMINQKKKKQEIIPYVTLKINAFDPNSKPSPLEYCRDVELKRPLPKPEDYLLEFKMSEAKQEEHDRTHHKVKKRNRHLNTKLSFINY